MSVIQFNKIYLTIAKLENNPEFLQALKRIVESQNQLYQKNPGSIHHIASLPRRTHSHFPKQI